MLTLVLMRSLFIDVTSTTGELPYASDCESESDFSITSTGSMRPRASSEKQKALATFATAFLKGEEPTTSGHKSSSLLKIVQQFGTEFDNEPDFVKRIREKLEELTKREVAKAMARKMVNNLLTMS